MMCWMIHDLKRDARLTVLCARPPTLLGESRSYFGADFEWGFYNAKANDAMQWYVSTLVFFTGSKIVNKR